MSHHVVPVQVVPHSDFAIPRFASSPLHPKEYPYLRALILERFE